MSPFRHLFALAAAACCALGAAQLGGKPWNPQNQVTWSVLTSGTQSRFTQPSFQVLSTENDLRMYWRANTGQAPETAPQGTNWLKEKLVAINLGQRQSGGYSVIVQDVVKNGVYATVYGVERTPVRGQWTSQQVTSPYIIIKVDRSAAQLKLEMSQREGGSTGGVTVFGPGGFRYNPNNYEREGGGGFVDPRFAADWQTYRSGTRSQIRQAGLFTLNTQPEWQRFWSKLTGDEPEFAPGGIDWIKYRVVAVCLGERPTTGFGVEVVNLEKHGVYGVIRGVEIVPVPGSRVRQRRTAPYVILKVERGIVQFNIDMSQREGNGDLRYEDGL